MGVTSDHFHPELAVYDNSNIEVYGFSPNRLFRSVPEGTEVDAKIESVVEAVNGRQNRDNAERRLLMERSRRPRKS
jgi:hypothetical protein